MSSNGGLKNILTSFGILSNRGLRNMSRNGGLKNISRSFGMSNNRGLTNVSRRFGMWSNLEMSCNRLKDTSISVCLLSIKGLRSMSNSFGMLSNGRLNMSSSYGASSSRVSKNVSSSFRVFTNGGLRNVSSLPSLSTVPKIQVDNGDWQKKICTKFDEKLSDTELLPVSKYLFDGQGKGMRPTIISAMSGAVNAHLHHDAGINVIKRKQELICLMAEMYHTASLYHDDVIDGADMRRGKLSVPAAWSIRHAILGGDFVLAEAYRMLADIDHQEVTDCMSRVVKDLISGELVQMSNKPDLTDLESSLTVYTRKCYLKTASLVSNSCRSVALLSMPTLAHQAEQYGSQLGIAFQVVDDILDIVSSPEELGKPGGGTDLITGVYTAPVLLVACRCPELQYLLQNSPDASDKILKLVIDNGGVEEARGVAARHGHSAKQALGHWKPSPHKNTLIDMVDFCLSRSC